jgi:hypothetical protein
MLKFFLNVFRSLSKIWLKKIIFLNFGTLFSDNIIIHKDTYEVQRCAWTSSE